MLFCFRFKFDINEYLPRLAPDAQVKTLEDIIKSGKFHPSIEKRLIDRQAEPPLDQNPRCAQVAQNLQRMRESVQKVMDDHTLDALVYPTWTFPPRMIGDLNTPHGNNSPRLSPPDRLSRDHRSHGVRARRFASWASGPRPRMERADVDQDRVRL